MSQLKRNAFYNTAYQVIRIIFPIITYPYVSRILGPEGIGKVSYAQTLAEYFTTFSMLGLPIYAMREISRSRAYPGQLEKNTGELLTLSFFLSIIAFLLYSLTFFLTPHLTADPLLHWVFAITVVFNWAQMDWFFQGIENYRYITIRNLFLRILSLLLIFLLVKSRNHYILYGTIWALSTVVSSLWNLWYCHRLTHPRWNWRAWKPHLMNSLPSALLSFSMFIYATIDTIMLGVMLTDDKYSVGIYNVAGRIVRIVMTIVGGINAGLLPRLAYIREQGDTDRIEQIIRKSLTFTLYLTLPACIGLVLVANDLIQVFAGAKFKPSVLTLQILSLELIFLGIESVLSKLLYASKKEKQLLTVSIMTLVIAVVSNAVCIPLYRQDGAAAATVFTRLVQIVLIVYLSRTVVRNLFNWSMYARVLLSCILLSLFIVGSNFLLRNFHEVYRLILIVGSATIFYAFLSSLFKIESYLILRNWILEKARIKKRGNNKEGC